MKVLEINKYPPSVFKKGRFLQQDWTSCSALAPGSAITPTKEEYLSTENKYVSAARKILESAPGAPIRAHNVEFWDDQSPLLEEIGLADVFDGSPAPAEGDALTPPLLVNAMRRCLREVAWLEFVVDRSLLVHFGYDLRLVIATALPMDATLEEIRRSGLFVYDSEAQLSTLTEWMR